MANLQSSSAIIFADLGALLMSASSPNAFPLFNHLTSMNHFSHLNLSICCNLSYSSVFNFIFISYISVLKEGSNIVFFLINLFVKFSLKLITYVN